MGWVEGKDKCDSVTGGNRNEGERDVSSSNETIHDKICANHYVDSKQDSGMEKCRRPKEVKGGCQMRKHG